MCYLGHLQSLNWKSVYSDIFITHWIYLKLKALSSVRTVFGVVDGCLHDVNCCNLTAAVSWLNLVTPWSWEMSHFPKLLLIWSDSVDLLQRFSCWHCYKPALHMHNIDAILPLTDTCYNLFENQHLHNGKVLELWLWQTWRNREGLKFLDIYTEEHLDRFYLYTLYYIK